MRNDECQCHSNSPTPLSTPFLDHNIFFNFLILYKYVIYPWFLFPRSTLTSKKVYTYIL